MRLTSRDREKKLSRILAFEDGSFSLVDRYCTLVGVLMEDCAIRKLAIEQIRVDGRDATRKVIRLARRLNQADAIMLPSVSLGGFNIVDPYEVYDETKLPVIVANPRRPRLRAVREALRQHFSDWEKRIIVFNALGAPEVARLGTKGALYFYSIGISKTSASALLRRSIHFGKKPEPLRVARILARALPYPSIEATRRV
jgi:endonuclease V-like protein UPF0215 family